MIEIPIIPYHLRILSCISMVLFYIIVCFITSILVGSELALMSILIWTIVILIYIIIFIYKSKYHIYNVLIISNETIQIKYHEYNKELVRDISFKKIKFKIKFVYYFGDNFYRLILSSTDFKIIQCTNKYWTKELIYKFKEEIEAKQKELGYLTPIEEAKYDYEKRQKINTELRLKKKGLIFRDQDEILRNL